MASVCKNFHGTYLYEKRGRVALGPSPERKEGKSGFSLELLRASVVPIHISLVLFRIDNNELEKNERPIFFAPLSRFLKALWLRSFKTFNEKDLGHPRRLDLPPKLDNGFCSTAIVQQKQIIEPGNQVTLFFSF